MSCLISSHYIVSLQSGSTITTKQTTSQHHTHTTRSLWTSAWSTGCTPHMLAAAYAAPNPASPRLSFSHTYSGDETTRGGGGLRCNVPTRAIVHWRSKYASDREEHQVRRQQCDQDSSSQAAGGHCCTHSNPFLFFRSPCLLPTYLQSMMSDTHTPWTCA